MPPTPKLENLDQFIGRSTTEHDVASAAVAKRFAAALDQDPELFAGRPLHPLGHWLHFTPEAPMSGLGTDGHAKLGGFIPDLGLPRRMWAGSSITYHSPIRLGQEMTKVSTITKMVPKHGSTGQLCFVDVTQEIYAGDTLALTDIHTIVYREADARTPDGSSNARPPRQDCPAPEGWDWVVSHRPDEATLFRYSALTFNGHRIHYDHPYTTGVEGYPGLIVHGPLMATYVVDDFIRQHTDATVTSFRFSARSPVFAGEQIHVAGRTTAPGEEELTVINPDGTTTISASITFDQP